MNHFLTLLISLMLVVGCNSRKNTATESNTNMEMQENKDGKNGIIYLKQGETLLREDLQMNITFKGISEDSRCPEGVNCAWQGVAVAEVEFLSFYARPQTVKFATVNMESKGYSNKAEYNGKRFTLVSLSPGKKQNQKIESYTIGIKVEENK
ncbi:MAG: hypothetical protein QM564_02655 [Bergeyella sp.]